MAVMKQDRFRFCGVGVFEVVVEGATGEPDLPGRPDRLRRSFTANAPAVTWREEPLNVCNTGETLAPVSACADDGPQAVGEGIGLLLRHGEGIWLRSQTDNVVGDVRDAGDPFIDVEADDRRAQPDLDRTP